MNGEYSSAIQHVSALLHGDTPEATDGHRIHSTRPDGRRMSVLWMVSTP
jgi:hypothetical protein